MASGGASGGGRGAAGRVASALRVGLVRLGLAAAIVLAALIPGDAAVPSSKAVAGRLDGIWYWTMPTTPNGLVPSESWSGAASAPGGDVYVAGMDHTTNSALYRLRRGVLSYVGDARSASEAEGNWQGDEIAEKFHTRPAWQDGRVYVATLNSSTLDGAYLGRRGFHWYAYDVAASRFVDLSAGQPGGAAAPHGGLVSQVVDRANNLIYGALAPTGDLYRYDIATGESTLLGRPDYRRPYVYPGRAMWMGRDGRLYFTAGNDELEYYGAPYDPAIFNHVYSYDPATGSFGEKTTWLLHDQRAIDAAQCFTAANGDVDCYLGDNVGHVYRFRETATSRTWIHLGDIGQQAREPFGYAWVFHVFRDRKTVYVVTEKGKFFEFNLVTRAAAFIGDLKALEPSLAGKIFIYGHDARAGKRFYFSAFSRSGNALLVAIDPERLKAAIAAEGGG